MGCHCGTGGRPISIREGIFRSCNSYFALTYKRSLEKFANPQIGLNKWSETIKKFGLGEYLGVDLPVGQKGLIPTADYYNHYYPEKNWRASTTISNAGVPDRESGQKVRSSPGILPGNVPRARHSPQSRLRTCTLSTARYNCAP